jgi:hypothetical protein
MHIPQAQLLDFSNAKLRHVSASRQLTLDPLRDLVG